MRSQLLNADPESPRHFFSELRFGRPRSDGDDAELWVKPSQIEGVARDDRKAQPLRADHDVSIGDVGRPRLREQRADSLSMRSVKRDHFGFIMLDHPPQAHLLSRIPNDLRENGGRNDDSVPVFQGRSENGKNSAIVSFDRNQAASIKSNSVHAAFRGLAPRLRGKSILLAQARSFGVSGPPVAFRAWSTIARNSAAFSRDFWTAC